MSPLEIISRLCDVTNSLSEIVRKQQEIIERSKVEDAVAGELRRMAQDADRELDIIEYHSRRYCDTDDVERPERSEPIDD